MTIDLVLKKGGTAMSVIKSMICIISLTSIAFGYFPTDYTGYEMIELRNTKQAWLSSASAEQSGNLWPSFTFYKFNVSHLLLMDWDVSSLPPFEEIAGVQMVFGEDERWLTTVSGIYYNCVRSDSDWTQASGSAFTVSAPHGEPSYLFCQSPDVPWAASAANLKELLMASDTYRPLENNRANEFHASGVCLGEIIFDLDLPAIKDLLEGTCHGLCFWGGSPDRYICNLYRLRVYKNQDKIEAATQKNNTSDQILLFPNPANPSINIQCPEEMVEAHISIFSINGDKLKTISTSKNSVFWDGTDSDGKKVTTGLYIYKVSGSINGTHTLFTGKFIVNK